jgi:hypothetical protein
VLEGPHEGTQAASASARAGIPALLVSGRADLGGY